MNTTLEKVDFQVHIEFNDKKEAVFSYTENGKAVDGGGTVRAETAGTYTLTPVTVGLGFFSRGLQLLIKSEHVPKISVMNLVITAKQSPSPIQQKTQALHV